MTTIHLKMHYRDIAGKLSSLEVFFEDAGEGAVRARYRINGKAKVTTRYAGLDDAYSDWNANVREYLALPRDPEASLEEE